MGFFFENLDVYEKSLALNEKIDSLVQEVPEGNFIFLDSLKKASLSISSNIAVSCGYYQNEDKISFLNNSRDSAYRCIPILELMKRKGLIKDAQLGSLREEIESISKMLGGFMKSLKNYESRKSQETALK